MDIAQLIDLLYDEDEQITRLLPSCTTSHAPQAPTPSHNGAVSVYGITWSPDSQQLVLVNGHSGAIAQSYSASTPSRRLFPLSGAACQQPPWFLSVAWSPDGRYLAASSNAGYGQALPSSIVWAWQISTHRIVFQHESAGSTDRTIVWLPGSHNRSFLHAVRSNSRAMHLERCQWSAGQAVPGELPGIRLCPGEQRRAHRYGQNTRVSLPRQGVHQRADLVA